MKIIKFYIITNSYADAQLGGNLRRDLHKWHPPLNLLAKMNYIIFKGCGERERERDNFNV